MIIRKLSIIILVLFFSVILFSNNISAAKTIKLETGETYEINVKKSKCIKLSNKKVLKVNKKGKVTALKQGKCTVKVIKRNKFKKYKFEVYDKIFLTTIKSTGYIVKNIEKTDDITSNIYLGINGKQSFNVLTSDEISKGIDTIKLTIKNEYLSKKELNVGDDISILVTIGNVNKTYENNICIITSGVGIY